MGLRQRHVYCAGVLTWHGGELHCYLGFYWGKGELYWDIYWESSCLTMVLQVKILDPTMRSPTQTCHEIPPPPMLTPNNPPMAVITL